MRNLMSVTVLAGAVALGGCDDKKTDATATPPPAASVKPAAASSVGPAASAKTEGKKPAIKPEAKTALNQQKPKETKGTWLDIPDTNGAFLVPEGWTTDSGNGLAIASSKDEKAGFVATTYAKGTDPTPILGKLAGALEFQECEWSKTEDVTLGPDNIPAKVADGVCLRKGKGVYVMYAMVSGQDLNAFVLAGWDEDCPEAEQQRVIDMILSLKVKDDKKSDKKE